MKYHLIDRKTGSASFLKRSDVVRMISSQYTSPCGVETVLAENEQYAQKTLHPVLIVLDEGRLWVTPTGY